MSFELWPGEALGLLGENGSGKSTSMNILGGVHQPDGGQMSLGGRPYAPQNPREASQAGIAFIHQELNLFPNLSIEENLFITDFPRRGGVPFIDRRWMRKRARELLVEVDLDLPPTRLVGNLAQGERQLVEIAKALHADAKVLILDEPTTSLTRREVERLFSIIERLKSRGVGIIFISHALGDVMHICERMTVLRDGAVIGTDRRERLNLPTVISMMVGRSIDAIYPERITKPRPEVALRVRNLTQRGVASDISFDIHAGEVVGLSGLMGSGRSELARLIFGLDPLESGTVEVAGTQLMRPNPKASMAAGLAFLTEDRRNEGLLMEASIADNIGLTFLRRFKVGPGVVSGQALNNTASELARMVHLSTDRVQDTLAKHLSGGNQQKVVIAKWLLRRPKVFILDEPTRGIDVGAKQEVYRIINRLVEEGGAVFLISSEIEEVMGLSDRILTISKGEITGSFERSGFDREAILAAAMAPAGPQREAYT
ncbi:sugar ABC transporter ATP-binding protein [Microvirga makkahensis]|uniref:sugar ABC transporter ATP-binding protein n=1 Tax=Microvirga makkahensis TaxID=1128670 RepID=UPI0031B580AE